jgi:protein-S-isoprenylcysteine O-methyltransferase Ste14
MEKSMLKSKKGEHPFGDAGQLICLAIFMVVWIGDSFFLHKSTAPADHFPLYVRLAVLALTLIIAVYLFRSGHIVIIHGHEPTNVINTGAFHYVRHPLYLASILTYLGLTVSTCSLFSFAVLAVIFAFYDHIARYEEKLLEKKFGSEYTSYKKNTGKWIPRFG